jgi:hypothetical protein
MRLKQQGLQEQWSLREAGSSGWSWVALWTWRSFLVAAVTAAAAAMCGIWLPFPTGSLV